MQRKSAPVGEDIVQIVQQCAHCQKYKPTTGKEPMVMTVIPDRPWQMLGVDLLDFNGQQCMVVVDYYSRYIELVYLADTIPHTLQPKWSNLEVISENDRFAKESYT